MSGTVSWPTVTEFSEAIQAPRLCFSDPELQSAVTDLNRRQLPKVWSGQFASVFKLRSPNGISHAVRCFLREVGDREERYRAVDQYLTSQPPPGFSRFRYLKSGIRVRQGVFPVLVMDWVDGQTLDDYVQQADPTRLATLPGRWQTLMQALETKRIAHGDLQHGNVLVAGDQFRLVDYDGMFVPALRGRQSAEVGHRHYQHPGRTERDFDEHIDRFAALVIYASLVAFAERPALRSECDDSLLFKAADYRDWTGSAVVARVRRELPQLTTLLDVIGASVAGPLAKVATVGEVAALAPKGAAGSAGSAGWWRDQVAPRGANVGLTSTPTPPWVREAAAASAAESKANHSAAPGPLSTPPARRRTVIDALRFLARTIRHTVVSGLVWSPLLLIVAGSRWGESLNQNETVALVVTYAAVVTVLGVRKARRQGSTRSTAVAGAGPIAQGAGTPVSAGAAASPPAISGPKTLFGGSLPAPAPGWMSGRGPAQAPAGFSNPPAASRPSPSAPAGSPATPASSWPPSVTTRTRTQTVWPPSPPSSARAATPPKPATTPSRAPFSSTSGNVSTPGVPSTSQTYMGPPVVASASRGKYHSTFCEWAMKISPTQRVTFGSAAEARRAGLRACKVCNP